jgi:hypothetical protein
MNRSTLGGYIALCGCGLMMSTGLMGLMRVGFAVFPFGVGFVMVIVGAFIL